MSRPPGLAVIVNTFNQPDYLGRVLRGLSRQSLPPAEVLLADDGSENQTRQVFANWSARQPFTCFHAWQPHEGFRRARVLNQAIARAKSDYLVFLDGDSIPHPDFVADHRRLAQTGAFIQGHRALLKQKAAGWFGQRDFLPDRRRAFLSGQLEGLKHAFRWPRPWVKARHDLRGIRGCNLGIWRANLVAVNGYNEAFVGWGREDSELALRLINLGVQRLDVRGWALCYHLWHQPASRAALAGNDELLADAQRQKATRCVAGLESHLDPISRSAT